MRIPRLNLDDHKKNCCKRSNVGFDFFEIIKFSYQHIKLSDSFSNGLYDLQNRTQLDFLPLPTNLEMTEIITIFSPSIPIRRVLIDQMS